MRTRAAVARTVGAPLELVDIDLDEPRADEILIRLTATGICHTDISAASGRLPITMPIVLGHEGAGVVVAIGSQIKDVAIGDHVVLTPDFCGKCRQCRLGHTAYCEMTPVLVFGGTRVDGSTKATWNGEPVRAGFFGQSSFAQFCLATERNVLRVPPEAPLHLLAALTCGVNAGAGSVLNALRLRPDQSIAVFGTGTVGLAAIMAAAICGSRTIIAVDRHESRLTLARELGATHTVNTEDIDDAARAIGSIVPGGVDASLDSTGNAGVLLSAIDAVGTRGTCGFVSGTGGIPLDLDVNRMLTKGKTLRAIMGGEGTGLVFLQQLVDYFNAGKLPVDRLVRPYPLEQINTAIDDMKSGATIKPVILFE